MQEHAVCITGLQRSYPEISRNIHYSLSSLYSGWHDSDNRASTVAAASLGPETIADAQRSKAWSLDRAVAFFGVRPANDSWASVRTDLPPLTGESIQTPCGLGRAPWFSAFAKSNHQRVAYSFSFVQMMCDLRACHQLVQDDEGRTGRQFATIARLRLDLAWETPLVMPRTLLPNTVYTSRMNTKLGLNDKWAIGRREAMATYLNRVQLIPLANSMWNRSTPTVSLRATSRTEGVLYYDCGGNSNINVAFRCLARRTAKTDWQHRTVSGALQLSPALARPQRRFVMTSEGFLMWALWRGNVTIAFEPSWMFCKFGNSVNTTARRCVPRMRLRKRCRSLVCTGGLTDCACQNTTCGGAKTWYCEEVEGIQLTLDPYGALGATL